MAPPILLAVLAAVFALHVTQGAPVPQVNELERIGQLEKNDIVSALGAPKRVRRFGADDDEDGAVMDEDEEDDVPPVVPARGIAQALEHNGEDVRVANSAFDADDVDDEEGAGAPQTNTDVEPLDPEADEDEVMGHQQRQEETVADENDSEDTQGEVEGYDSAAAEPEGDANEKSESPADYHAQDDTEASGDTSENEEASAEENDTESPQVERDGEADDVSNDINDEGESIENSEEDVDLDSMSEEEGEDMVTSDFLFEVNDSDDKQTLRQVESEAGAGEVGKADDEAGKGIGEQQEIETEDDYNEEDDE